MALVDGVLRPGYVAKSAIKIAVFLLIPLIASRLDKHVRYLPLLRPKKKGLLPAIALGVSIYAVILGGYFLVSPFFDFSQIAGALTENAGVTRSNFLYVSLYISFANSFLEEFFFRGFVFTNLKQHAGRKAAYLCSATAFSLYHVAMMVGWFSPALFLLVMAGLVVGGMLFNWLNEKLDTIYCSWLTHMFANFAINTIGFILLQ
jgi:membrane protease YdiL (CAAX protease family)